MPTPNSTVEGFSISHAAILDGSTGAQDADIYGIREGSIEVDTDNYDNTGDDAVLSTWYWFNYAMVSVTAGYISFEQVALLTGSSITSSGTDENIFYNIPLWEETSLNQPTRPMMIRVPSKDSNGMIRDLDFVLYKVQFEPMSFDGPSYKDGLLTNYSGKALISNVDEKGDTLARRSIGRLVSRPAVGV